MDKVDLIVKRLYEAMEKSNLSYADLSTMTGIPKAVVHRYINGITRKIPLDRLEKISKALGVETTDILGWTVDNKVVRFQRYAKYLWKGGCLWRLRRKSRKLLRLFA